MAAVPGLRIIWYPPSPIKRISKGSTMSLSNEFALRKTGSGWEFISEAALEDFVWANLQPLLGLTPIARQLIVMGEICDIVAIDEHQGLVILELKNTEDRYVVQQLTRYYANLVEARPFQNQVDYSRPVRLIALAPSFHRHNLIDREHNKLNIELLVTAVVKDEGAFYLRLMADPKINGQAQIHFREIDNTIHSKDVSPPPKRLVESIGACSQTEQEQLLKVRSRLLTFHPGIKETVESGSILYGAAKGKACAEIRFSKNPPKPVLFLWLPFRKLLTNRRQPTGRMRLWSNGHNVTHIGYVPEGMGTMKLLGEWESNLKPESVGDNGHYVDFDFGNDRYIKGKHVMSMSLRSDGALNSQIPIPIKELLQCRADQEKPVWGTIYPNHRCPLPRYAGDAREPNFWEILTDLALKSWLKTL